MENRKRSLMEVTPLFAGGLALLLPVLPCAAETPVACAIFLDESGPTNVVEISWQAKRNHFYGVRTTTDLAQPWQDSVTPLMLASPDLPSSPMQYRAPADAPQRFFQIVDLDLTWIPPGVFIMGSPTNQPEARSSEAPTHEVTIARGFWMGIHEVTQGEYLSLMHTNPSYFAGLLRRPVDQVSWDDATNYCAQRTSHDLALGRILPNYHYRLPTEAEWEYACRAGSTTRFSFGDDLDGTAIPNYAWYLDNSDVETHAVALKAQNPWDLCDLYGNVWEWCQDWYGPYTEESVTDPQGPSSGGFRVKRGGSYLFAPRDCRSARRSAEYSWSVLTDLGFRMVLVPSLP